jgi:hypothetical protein
MTNHQYDRAIYNARQWRRRTGDVPPSAMTADQREQAAYILYALTEALEGEGVD